MAEEVEQAKSRSRPKPVVAVDLDEVLGHFVPQLVLHHNKEYGFHPGQALSVDHFQSYDFSKVWGGTHREADAKMQRFFHSSYFLGQNGEGLPVIAGARVTLERFLDRIDFFVVTSRHDELAQETIKWINSHFPGIFQGVLLGNHYSTCGGVKRSKPELCAEIQAVLLIDDNENYVKEAVLVGLDAVLFGSYPWNKGKPPLGAKRALDWSQVGQILDDFLISQKSQS